MALWRLASLRHQRNKARPPRLREETHGDFSGCNDIQTVFVAVGNVVENDRL